MASSEFTERKLAAIIHERIRTDARYFLRDLMGWEPWARQLEIAQAVEKYPRVAVRSCHSSGKTAIAARIVLRFLLSYRPAVVVTTAPTYLQVNDLLWREIRNAYQQSRIPIGGKLYERPLLELDENWFAIGLKPEDTEPERFQGFHSANVLLVVDEASGVSENIFEAADGILTSENSRELLLGNPTRLSGRFYDAFHDKTSLYHTIHINALKTPNILAGKTVRPYLITQQYINDIIESYGEDSDVYRVKVGGEFPLRESEALIPLDWIVSAEERQIIPPYGAPRQVRVVAVDPAAGGVSETAIGYREGEVVKEVIGSREEDTMVIAGKVAALATEKAVDAIVVDRIGLGMGIGHRLMEVFGDPARGGGSIKVYEFTASEKALDPKRFKLRRDEMWYHLRQRFQAGNIGIPKDHLLRKQLAGIQATFTSAGQFVVKVESKAEMVKRGLETIDRADVVAMLFAYDPPRRDDQPYVIQQPYTNPWHAAIYGVPQPRRRYSRRK